MNTPNTYEYKKIIIVSAILIALIGGIFILRSARKSSPENKIDGKTQISESVPTNGSGILNGELKVELTSKSIKMGGTVSAAVILSATGKRLDGADAILHFDPTVISADENLVLGEYFMNYSRKSVDNTKGIIKVSAYRAKSDQALTGPTTFFTVTFKAVRVGSSKIWFDYKKEKTNLSNLVEHGTSKNILGNVSYTIVTVAP